nr:MAG TPA: hypothetical protein [Caudoviricetes sp.]
MAPAVAFQRAFHTMAVVYPALAIMTVLTLLVGEIALHASFCCRHSGNNLHKSSEILVMVMVMVMVMVTMIFSHARKRSTIYG